MHSVRKDNRYASVPRTGRRPATTRGELERVAFRLFVEQGFERTTVEDIARGAGIARRTFFHYFASKNDVVWGDFDGELARLRRWLARCPPEQPIMDALQEAIVQFNSIEPAQVATHRLRMSLILGVPQLQAYSTLRYAAWREVIADFVAARLDGGRDALLARVIGHALLGVALAAYETWLADETLEITQVLDRALRELAEVYANGPLARGGPASEVAPARPRERRQSPV
jgi:mycofactocin system transcriptional regulator